MELVVSVFGEAPCGKQMFDCGSACTHCICCCMQNTAEDYQNLRLRPTDAHSCNDGLMYVDPKDAD